MPLNDMSEQQTIAGSLERVSFHNPETGWTVLQIAAQVPELLTAVGIMADPSAGESVKLTGTWEKHARYGRQFRFHDYQLLRPATAESITKYLSGDLIEGIGPKLAAALVEKFGEQTLHILDTAPQRVQEVPGIGPQRAAALTAAWRRHQDMHQVMTFLYQHGLGPALATRIYACYGPHAIEVLEANPYRLPQEIGGIGFLTADRIARSLGLAEDRPQRLQAALLHVLDQATGAGHFYLPREQLVARGAQLVQMSTQQLAAALAALVEAQRLVIEPGLDDAGQMAVYLPEMAAAEREVAQRLATIARISHDQAPVRAQVQAWLQRREAFGELPLTAEQKSAVSTALASGLGIITGGPGTGKTTIIRLLADACDSLGRRVALAAPTGRAAKRLEQLSGRPASTIHRLLAYDPRRGGFRYGCDEPLPVDTLIIDEASMVDVLLARDLLRALVDDSQLVLVGDADQLPSVGPGNMLRDLVDADIVSVCRLTTIHRQRQDSLLVHNAHCINRGENPRLPTGDTWQGEDCVFLPEDDPEAAAQKVLQAATVSLPRVGFAPHQIQVITPLHRGPLGVQALNRALQQRLNPPGSSKDELRRGEIIFRTGDRVLQTVNNYDKSVYNGDIGRLAAIEARRRVFTVTFEQAEVSYDFGEVDQLELAYALTIHKSQGSEYPTVVMVIHSSHYVMLQRNLMYTALTRAEKMVCIVGNWRGIWKAIKTAPERQRHTYLGERLREELLGQRGQKCRDPQC